MLVQIDQTHIHPALRHYIEFRKSGLSVNHVVGCPLDCAYCVRHFWGNFEQKEPQLLASDEEAFAALLSNPFFVPHLTPVQLFNRATDPFLPKVKRHTLRFAQLMDGRGLQNHLLIITRYRVEKEDVAALENLTNLRVTVLFTFSGMNGSKIEPIPEGIPMGSIKTSFANKNRVKTILYWRPIVEGWNDSEETFDKVLHAATLTDALVFTGLFFRKEQEEFFRRTGIEPPYASPHRRKILPVQIEKRVLDAYTKSKISTPIFRKTSCAVSYVHEVHDYNGHYGIPEICDICPSAQVERCKRSHKQPTTIDFGNLLREYGYATDFEVKEGHILTSELGEEKRYHLQHTLGFQVWDRKYPHLPGRHGRAMI
jgi:DNA repair photolyase